MAGNFEGWLIKFGTVTLPNSFLLADGWGSTPDQRLERDAYRDEGALLHRVTLPNFKTTIKMTFRDMNLLERIALNNVIKAATTTDEDTKQRRTTITYWNDETLKYDTGVFYMAQPEFKIHSLNEKKKDIEYASFELEFIEY